MSIAESQSFEKAKAISSYRYWWDHRPGKFNEDSGNEHLASEFTVGADVGERLDWFLAADAEGRSSTSV